MIVIEVFAAMSTQWNVGFGGPVGLRYEALPPVLKALRVPAADHGTVLAGLRLMEREALRAHRG